MNADQARTVILEAMVRVAPEADPAALDDDRDLTTQLDLDSMDYLHWMLEINRATGIEIPAGADGVVSNMFGLTRAASALSNCAGAYTDTRAEPCR